jgi:hypothetical protein
MGGPTHKFRLKPMGGPTDLALMHIWLWPLITLAIKMDAL